MKVCSKANRTFSAASWRTRWTIGSWSPCSGAPARLSSQFDDHSIFIGLPVICETGRATGKSSPSGASVRLRYSYVQGS